MEMGRVGLEPTTNGPEVPAGSLVGLVRNVHVSSPDDPDVATAQADTTVLGWGRR